jgi:transcriptional regulator with XRE-family HTH domain
LNSVNGIVYRTQRYSEAGGGVKEISNMTIKRQQKRPTAPREPNSARTIDADLAKRIKELRDRLKLTMGPFADRLEVSKASVSLWEKGDMPSAEALLKLAKLASEDEALRLYFLRQAGVDTERLEIAVAKEYLQRRERRLDDPANGVAEVDWLPIRASASAAAKEAIGYIPVVKTRIANPETTFCVEVGADSARGPYPVGSLVIIDGSRRGILGPDKILDWATKVPDLAVFCEELPHRELVSPLADRHGSWPHEDLRKYLEALDREDQVAPRLGPGVRFGTVHLEGIPTDEGRFWSFTLGPSDRQDRRFCLTKWRDGRLPPTDEAAHSMLKKGIHVLGTVIGSFAPIRATYPVERIAISAGSTDPQAQLAPEKRNRQHPTKRNIDGVGTVAKTGGAE